MKFLIDSVILIDHFNGIPQASGFLRDVKGEAVISVITRAEVLAGFPVAKMTSAARLLDTFDSLPIEAPVADLAARLRREQRWKLPDALQAALAQHHGLVLATRNTKDFPPERYSFAEVPYALT